MITVRTLRIDEPMPEGFNTGYERMPFMPHWVWVAEKDGEALGLVLAAPCHGLAYIMRVCVKKGSPAIVAFILLRRSMKEMRARGLRGYFTHIDPTRDTERHLMLTCRQAGAKTMT